MNKFDFDAALAALTLEQAEAWLADPEKWLHVDYRYLECWEIDCTYEAVGRVEDRFEALLAGGAA